jgi:methyl-accepting chemotaxis protein
MIVPIEYNVVQEGQCPPALFLYPNTGNMEVEGFMKLKLKLTLIFSTLVAVLLLILSYAAYSYTKELLTHRIESEVNSYASAQVNKLDGWLLSKVKMLEITAGTLQTTADKTQITIPMVAGFQVADPEISDLYFGSAATGEIVDGKGWQAPADFDSRTRSWYKAAIGAGKVVFADPYLDKVTNKMALPVAMPLKDSSGAIRGVLSEDILLQTMIDTIKAINPYETGYAFLLDSQGTVIVHPDEKIMGKNILAVDELKDLKDTWQAMLQQDHGIVHCDINGQPTLLTYQKIPSSSWILAVHIPSEKAFAPLAGLRWLFGIGTLIAILLVALTTLYISRRLAKPIEILSGQVSQLAQGDLTVHAEASSQDEIGQLATDFNKMAGYLRTLIKKVQMQSEQLAASSEELTASSEQSAEASEQVAKSIAIIGEQADKQNEAAGKTTHIVEEMAANIEQIASNADKASSHSIQTKAKAKTSGDSLDKAVNQMDYIEKTVNASAAVVVKLNERSTEIGQIVEAISNIAGQTNLLALNAAIEAARAGEQGRGFAVVAEEVRKLAEQSQTATKQISELITSIQDDTIQAVTAMESGTKEVRKGTETVNEAGRSFQEISSLLDEQAGQIQKISESIGHIDSSAQHIVGLVKNMDSFSKRSTAGIQQVSSATQEQQSSTEEISHASANLAELAQELQTVIAEFKV